MVSLNNRGDGVTRYVTAAPSPEQTRVAIPTTPMRMRLLRFVALVVATVFLLTLLQPAHAIITPDEPTPRNPAPVAAQQANSPQDIAVQMDRSNKPVGSQQASTPGGAAAKPSSVESTGKQSPSSYDSLQEHATVAGSRARITSEATTATTTGGVQSSHAGTPLASDHQAVELQSPKPSGDKDAPVPPSSSTVEIVHERYVRGRGPGEYYDDDESDDRDLFASSSFEIEDSDSDGAGGKRQNYASLDAGATILDSSPELKSPTNLLVPDKDRYMLMPCEKPRKWVVVSLSEDVHADAIAIANFEKFSSTVKDFIVLGSVNYPTDTWFVLGNFTAAQSNGEQIFPLDSQHHVRYIKLRFFSHYGSEYYCTLSQLKVYGRTFTQVISQLEKSIDAEAVLDAAVASLDSVDKDQEVVVVKDMADAGMAAAASGSHQHQCPVTSATLLAREVLAASSASSKTCSRDDAPKQSPLKIPPFPPPPLRQGDDHPADALTPRELAELEALGHHVDHHQQNTPSTTAAAASTLPSQTATSNTSTTTTTGGGASTAPSKSNASATMPTPTTSQQAPASSSSSQGLGRLESIFVRITKKIHHLELNQSAFARQLEDTQAQQKALSTSLHAKQDALATQMQEIRVLLTEMRTRMDRDTTKTNRLVEELRKENAALWAEMLIVREVITTMKAAILCALVLSACIITFYLLRLLFRCVKGAKKRADLREWFWRVESLQQERSASQSEEEILKAAGAAAAQKDPVGAWRVNYNKQFGSSWDDSAIERKTMVQDLLLGVDATAPTSLRTHTLDGGSRNRRARTASLMVAPTLKHLMAQMELAYIKKEKHEVPERTTA